MVLVKQVTKENQLEAYFGHWTRFDNHGAETSVNQILKVITLDEMETLFEQKVIFEYPELCLKYSLSFMMFV